jgi:broad specificity phosphatase PhoE
MSERPGRGGLTILFSPHATSVDNEVGRASGHADVPLSALGRRQAAELGRHYASLAVDTVACSDLRRAHDTALIAFGDRGLPIRPDPRLREFDYGDQTQCPRDELALEAHVTLPYPGGESVAMAVERVGAFLREAIVEHAGQTLAVIGHVATRYGLELWSSNTTLEEVVAAPWEWRDVPIWRYTLDPAVSHRIRRLYGRSA